MYFCLLSLAALVLRGETAVTGNNNNGHALDNDEWLSTVSQYDKDRYWDKFRDVSFRVYKVTCALNWLLGR